MYCPKCKQNFEENSRRFCPTDGSRLVSESSGGGHDGGIFANLISKMDGLGELTPARRPSEPPRKEVETASHSADEIFFELDDLELDLPAQEDFFAKSGSNAATLPTRKINPFEIPAGHIELGEGMRSSTFNLDFDDGEPENFVGRTVKGRYRVTEFLGGDENGWAYLADDKIVEQRMVLVRILFDDGDDEIMSGILSEERVSLSHFSHPNTARLIDSGQFTGGVNFIVSEYIDALSVADILAIHGHLDASRTARIIRQAAGALSEAHQQGILHRDIRPENLILDTTVGDSEQVKVVNFGASSGDPTTRNAAYKAAEVLDGRVASLSTDTFSLAVVAFQMLTGKLPFTGSDTREFSRAQRVGVQALPSELEPELAKAIDEVMLRALALKPSDRYPKTRDFGDAFFAAAAGGEMSVVPVVATADPSMPTASRTQILQPLVPAVPLNASLAATAPLTATSDEPAWKNRSPEPPQEANRRSRMLATAGILALLAVVAAGWYFLVNNPQQTEPPASPAGSSNNDGDNPSSVTTEMPPLSRTIPQPPDTNFYQNSKQNLRGDLLRNFVGFTMYYPKDWKVNGPQPSADRATRGQFLDISRPAPNGQTKEQMLVSYYPSKGTYSSDAESFSQQVKETNETLKKILPNYQMLSEGEIKLNGDWRAYEVKFQAGGTSDSGEKITLWGRRLFIPAARPGVRNGFVITMLATSAAEQVRGVDDVGVKGELGPILYSFEPSQNF